MDYSTGIHPHDITLDEIRFFYEPLVGGLCKLQKEAKRSGR